MSCNDFPDYISFANHFGGDCEHPIWGPGVSFTVEKPWPKRCCVQHYDVPKQTNGSEVEIEVDNGRATYVVVEQCEHGGGQHLELRSCVWRHHTKGEKQPDPLTKSGGLSFDGWLALLKHEVRNRGAIGNINPEDWLNDYNADHTPAEVAREDSRKAHSC